MSKPIVITIPILPMGMVNAHAIVGTNGVVLIDTGCGNDKVRNEPAFRRFHGLNLPYLDRLAECGVRPEDVTLVINTHLHVDHVGWNTRKAGDAYKLGSFRAFVGQDDHLRHEAFMNPSRIS